MLRHALQSNNALVANVVNGWSQDTDKILPSFIFIEPERKDNPRGRDGP